MVGFEPDRRLPITREQQALLSWAVMYLTSKTRPPRRSRRRGVSHLGGLGTCLCRQRIRNEGESIVNRCNLVLQDLHLKPGNAVQETYRRSAGTTLKDCNFVALTYWGKG